MNRSLDFEHHPFIFSQITFIPFQCDTVTITNRLVPSNTFVNSVYVIFNHIIGIIKTAKAKKIFQQTTEKLSNTYPHHKSSRIWLQHGLRCHLYMTSMCVCMKHLLCQQFFFVLTKGPITCEILSQGEL